MDGLNIDYNRLPVLAILILVFVNTFKKPLENLITSLVPEVVLKFFGIRSQREEHKQAIEEALLDGEIQTQIADQMRDTQRERELLQLLKNKDRWLENVLTSRLERMQAQQAKMIEILGAIQRSGERTNNILETIHITLSMRRSNGP